MNNKLKITATVSVALLIGGGTIAFKDDISQNFKQNQMSQYQPVVTVQEQLEQISGDLKITENHSVITATNPEIQPLTGVSTNTAETTDSEITETNLQTSDTLPEDVMQSLIDSAVSLKNAYTDAVGLLYIPDTAISYPIIQGGDNDFYLSHAYDGSYLKSGSVFLDCCCESRFMNPVNVLYAHNMNNGSMFEGVLNFTDSAYFDAHRYGWLATYETVYRIDFFSAARADCYDSLYDGSMPVSDWIPHIESLSVVFRNADYSENDRFISLSTCSYEFQNARTVLTGKLVKMNGD